MKHVPRIHAHLRHQTQAIVQAVRSRKQQDKDGTETPRSSHLDRICAAISIPSTHAMSLGHLRVVACTPHVEPASFGSIDAFQQLCEQTVAFSGVGEANGFPKVCVGAGVGPGLAQKPDECIGSHRPVVSAPQVVAFPELMGAWLCLLDESNAVLGAETAPHALSTGAHETCVLRILHAALHLPCPLAPPPKHPSCCMKAKEKYFICVIARAVRLVRS